MKTSFSAFLIIAFLASASLAFACQDGDGEEHHAAASDTLTVTKASAKADANVATEATRVRIAGIHCASCQKSISSKLEKVDGFRSVTFEIQKSSGEKSYVAEIRHLPGKMNAEAILKAIAEAGDYKATVLGAK